MRTLIILALLVGVTFLLGWWKYSGSEHSAVISIDKHEIRNDTAPALNKVQELVGDQTPASTPDERPAEDNP